MIAPVTKKTLPTTIANFLAVCVAAAKPPLLFPNASGVSARIAKATAPRARENVYLVETLVV